MIIDTHIHVGPMARQYCRDYSVKALVDIMDKFSIDTSISTNTWTLDHRDAEYGAEMGCKIYEESKGRILSYHYYDPRKIDESIDIMNRYLNEKAYVGIKLHPSWTFTSADDETYRAAWEFAKEHKLPILAHSWDLSPTNPKQAFAYPARFEKFVKEYPEVTFTLAHSGGRAGGIRAACELAKKYPNVMLDVAGDIWPNHFVEYLCENIGADRIMFASDYTMMDQRIMLGVIIGADLSIEDKEKILEKNAKRVFGL